METWRNRGLGRVIIPDERDAQFPIRRMAAAQLDPESLRSVARGWRHWNAGPPYLDQGSAPACVGFSWAHWLIAGPLAQRNITEANAITFYHLAQTMDEWPGTAYEGSSVRGGAKALRQAGFITEFRWASSVEDVIHALLTAGPLVVGVDWFEGMDDPDGDHVMHATGALLGGHAFVLTGVNRSRGVFRMKNSWGRAWADEGRAWLPFDDFAKLLANQGEACLAIETRPPMLLE